ncbi:GNAT family N-acetyltransferase [Leptolyngbya sp. AN03gr2]|uniref:GNAT family N-acetyltransferase n=1 Tax=unclassified Leptolyngbya TaxID=2650499 RepID=UPI003D31EC46
MQATLTTRRGTIADIPFLARIQYEASLPPLNYCFWEEILKGTEISALEFIEAMLRTDASNWGNASDFLILEEDGKPVAAAAGYTPHLEDYRPLKLAKLKAIAQDLNWSEKTTAEFRDRYETYWGHEFRPDFLKAQAPWIIEYVAVVPEARGRGLGKVLLKALLEEGKAQQHSHAGIMVIHGNEVARRTYESIGFKPYLSFHADYFSKQYDINFPGITKFCMALKEQE